MSDDERVERALRTALREAADQVEVRVPTPTELPDRTAKGRRTNRSRAPVAVAATFLVVGTLAAAFVLTRRTAEPTVATDPRVQRHVEPSDLGRDEADLLVVMAPDATGGQVAAVREVIASSSEVVRFAEVAGEEALRDLMAAMCPGLDAIYDEMATTVLRGPVAEPENDVAGDIRPSFRIAVDDGDEGAVARLRDALAGLPGVMSIDEPKTDAAKPAGSGATQCGGVTVVVVCSPLAEGGAPPTDPRCQGGGPGPATDEPPAEGVPLTTTPTLPLPSGEEPADPDAARAAIIETFTTAYNGSLPVELRRAHIEDSEELGPYMDRSVAPYGEIVAHQTVTLGDIVFLDAERAAVAYTLTFEGLTAPITGVGYAVVDDDGRWKVSRETVCAQMMGAGVTCPPRKPS